MQRDDRIWIEDLGSKNGTFVAGQRVTAAPLADGDVFVLGATICVYRHDRTVLGPDLADLSLADVCRDLEPFPATFCTTLSQSIRHARSIADAPVPIHVTGGNAGDRVRMARAIHLHSKRPGRFVTLGDRQDRRTLMKRVDAATAGTLFIEDVFGLEQEALSALVSVLQAGRRGDASARVIMGSAQGGSRAP